MRGTGKRDSARLSIEVGGAFFFGLRCRGYLMNALLDGMNNAPKFKARFGGCGQQAEQATRQHACGMPGRIRVGRLHCRALALELPGLTVTLHFLGPFSLGV